MSVNRFNKSDNTLTKIAGSGGGSTKPIIMSQEDYDALTEEQKNDGTPRYVETEGEGIDNSIEIDEELNNTSNNAISNKAVTEKLGTTDISEISDGTVTGSISELNSALTDLSGRQGVSNPNLLDNAWFTVNQRGATQARNNYALDRYYGSYDYWGTHLQVCQLYQYIDAKKIIDGAKYTLSVKYSNAYIEHATGTMKKKLVGKYLFGKTLFLINFVELNIVTI